MVLSLIVAMTKNRVIGRRNTLPWHLSEDLKRFKAITMGNPIIMGRKTFDSIGRPLPGRENVVITRNKVLKIPGVRVAHSLEEALKPYQATAQECFVIGGAALFGEVLNKANKIYMTLIENEVQGDTYFPLFDMEKHFNVTERSPIKKDEEEGLRYSFITAERK